MFAIAKIKIVFVRVTCNLKQFRSKERENLVVYLNGWYPNGCRDRESQDRESENTVARHH